MNRRGQALIEWAVLAPLFLLLWAGLLAFGEWFLIRQELLMAAKEGAFLYSSGRIDRSTVQRCMLRRLARSHPALSPEDMTIRIGPTGSRLMQLDKVMVSYRPRRFLLRYFSGPLEESCVIKHAPPYYLLEWPATFGPPVRWSK